MINTCKDIWVNTSTVIFGILVGYHSELWICIMFIIIWMIGLHIGYNSGGN